MNIRLSLNRFGSKMLTPQPNASYTLISTPARGASFEEAGYEPPEEGVPDYRTFKTTTSRPAVVSKATRASKEDRAKLQRLLVLAREIREAIEREDRAAAGAKLEGAKRLLDHGKFEEWVEREIGVSSRTARRYME